MRSAASNDGADDGGGRLSRASLFIPLTAFVMIVALLYAGFSLNDPHQLPSALIGKPFPAFDLPRS